MLGLSRVGDIGLLEDRERKTRDQTGKRAFVRTLNTSAFGADSACIACKCTKFGKHIWLEFDPQIIHERQLAAWRHSQHILLPP